MYKIPGNHRMMGLLLGLAVLMVGLITFPERVSGDSGIEAELSQALKHNQRGECDDALQIALAQFQRRPITIRDSVAILDMVSLAYFTKGKRYFDTAYAYLDTICAVGPCVVPLPRDRWPHQLKNQWFRVANSNNALTCSEHSAGKTTIAIMPFDNHSVAPYLNDLGSLGAGLAQNFITDFRKISALAVVEREKLDYIIREHDLAQSGIVDQSHAVEAGKLLGAQLMIFGDFVQISDRATRMNLRVVDVETSEIITTVSEEGRPDYFKLEKALVKNICDELEITLSKDEEKQVDMGGTKDLTALAHYARGLDYEDRDEVEKAYNEFKAAYALDSGFEEAKQKMDVYAPMIAALSGAVER